MHVTEPRRGPWSGNRSTLGHHHRSLIGHLLDPAGPLPSGAMVTWSVHRATDRTSRRCLVLPSPPSGTGPVGSPCAAKGRHFIADVDLTAAKPSSSAATPWRLEPCPSTPHPASTSRRCPRRPADRRGRHQHRRLRRRRPRRRRPSGRGRRGQQRGRLPAVFAARPRGDAAGPAGVRLLRERRGALLRRQHPPREPIAGAAAAQRPGRWRRSTRSPSWRRRATPTRRRRTPCSRHCERWRTGWPSSTRPEVDDVEQLTRVATAGAAPTTTARGAARDAAEGERSDAAEPPAGLASPGSPPTAPLLPVAGGARPVLRRRVVAPAERPHGRHLGPHRHPRGVHKAPANELVRGALDLTYRRDPGGAGRAQPAGVNCIRFFPARASASGAPGPRRRGERVALPQRPPPVQHARGVDRRGHPLDRLRAQRPHPLEVDPPRHRRVPDPGLARRRPVRAHAARRRSSSSATRRPTRPR